MTRRAKQWRGRLTLHSHQELCLHPSHRIVLSLRSGRAHGVNLINEDDRRAILIGQVKEVLHKSADESDQIRDDKRPD